MKILISLSFALGFLTLLGFFLSFLALSDIYNNNEPNLAAEWTVVNIWWVTTFVFTVIAVLTIYFQAKKALNKN